MAELKEGVVGGALNLYFIYKFLRILTTPWESTDAFKLGIVDEKGKILKKHRKLKKDKEKEAYTLMHRLVWKLKRLMEKIPFGKSRLASYAAALWLIKEEKSFHGTDEELQESFLTFLETNWKNNALILKEKYEGDMDKKTFSNFRKEGIDIAKSSMKDVIKDFQSSDAPQFKGKSDKKKKEMAIAAKLSKEEVEINEMMWEVGVVYHQEFKNGDRVYFRADSVQKNKRWKGMSVDEFGGKQKKAKNASADEKQQGWVTTPEKEIPKALKEEVEIQEHCGECEMGITEEVTAIDYDRLKKGDIITIEFKSSMSSGKSKFKVTAKNIVGKAKVGKVTLQNVKNPKSVKFFLYKRGNKVSLAQGDMAASVVKYTVEEVEIEENPMVAGAAMAAAKKELEKKKKKDKKEEVEIDEKKGSGYELYHKDFSSAMQHAYAHAKKKGVIVDPKEIDDKVATGPKKPSSGKTNRYILGTNTRKKVHIQVANLDNKRYELNMYIEGVELDEYAGTVKRLKMKKKAGWLKKEEVELDEALKPKDKLTVDAFYYRKGRESNLLSTNGNKLEKLGMGRQTIAKWNKSGKIEILAVSDVKSTESILKYMKKSIPKGNFDPKSYSKFFEDVDEKKVPKLKFKLKQFKHLKPKKKKKEHGSYGKFSDTSGPWAFMKSKDRSYGYVGAYNEYMPEATVLSITDVNQWTHEIYKGIKAGWKSVSQSTLGGDENVAIMIKVTVEPEKDWPNKILHNAKFGMIRIATDGTMEMFASGHKIKNMRKTKIKSAKDVVNKINTWIKKVDEGIIEFSSFTDYLTEGRPRIDDPDARRPGDEQKQALLRTQKKIYKPEEVLNIARKHKVRMDGEPVGGKAWGGDWEIAIRGGITLDYDYENNETYIKGWKVDRKKIRAHITKYEQGGSTYEDLLGRGGLLNVRGFETAFELIGESVELKEEFWAVIDKAKGGEVMAVTTDEKDAKSSVKHSTTSKYDYHYGKDPKTLKVVKVMGKHSQKKAEKMIGTKLSFKEEAPANSVAGGNVNLDPFKKKKKRINAKVEYEDFAGTRVFIVPNERWNASRLGKNRYSRYEKYVGNDKLGETIRSYGRTNPKSPIILKNEENGAMLYLKYGGSKRKW